MVELGRVDITHAVSIMSSISHAPREGHFLELLHIFGYLKRNKNLVLMLNPQDFYHKKNISYDINEWKDFYFGSTENVPQNAPSPRGKSMSTTVFVDADHDGDLKTRRSHQLFGTVKNRLQYSGDEHAWRRTRINPHRCRDG